MATVITGITGQDGPYLAKLLLEKGETVFGAFRRTSTTDFWRLRKLGIADHPNLHLIEHDLTDPASSIRLLEKSEATHVYNLAAQSFVGDLFEQPVATTNIIGLGAVHLLEAIRVVNSEIRYYQASTSEMFGKVQQSPQNETTPFYPRSPYGIAKLYAHWMTVNYREAYGIFGVSGILFNHESPLRGKEFVTRKITDAVARIKLEKQEFLELGNLDAKRDWGFAGDFVEGIYRMLNADTPDTYVLATGRAATVREFVSMACAAADIAIVWEGSGLQEVGIDENTGNKIIGVNPDYFRPTDVDCLCGDFSKAKEQLGWEPKTSLNQLCEMMVYADLAQHSK